MPTSNIYIYIFCKAALQECNVKIAFGCTAKQNKVIYKCIIHSFI